MFDIFLSIQWSSPASALGFELRILLILQLSTLRLQKKMENEKHVMVKAF